MKKYNQDNYNRYKNDLKVNLNRKGKKEWRANSRDE